MKNMIDKFREFLSDLHQSEKEDLWDILTALRGADIKCGYMVKWHTTARIRGELLGDGYRSLPAFIAPSLAVAKRETCPPPKAGLSFLKEEFQRLPVHARDHIKSAINALSKRVPKSRVRDLQKFLKW